MGLISRLGGCLTVVVTGCLLAACGGASRLTETGPNPAPETTSPPVWPQFPPDTETASPSRRVAENMIAVHGADYVTSQGPGNYEPAGGDAYVLVSDPANTPAWALYTLDEFATDRPVSLTITVEPAPAEAGGELALPLNYWIGVGNYTAFCWDWHGPYSATTAVTLNSHKVRDRCVTMGGALQLLVLTMADAGLATAENPAGLTAARIDLAEVTTLPATDPNYYATRPHYAALTSVALGSGKSLSELDPATQYVHLAWQHYYDPANDANEALQYKIYRQSPADKQRVPIDTVNAPETTFCDPHDSFSWVDEPTPGITYTYFVRAYNPAGFAAYDATAVTIPADPSGADVIAITDCTVRITGASGGLSADQELFNSTKTVAFVKANAATELSLEWISGTFNGVAFAGETSSGWPPDMTQADYDAALATTRANLQWMAEAAGAPGYRYVGSTLILDDGEFPLAGDPGGATLTSDYDPESGGSFAEGRLNLYLPGDLETTYPATADLEIQVPTPVAYAISLDLSLDSTASRILGLNDETGIPIEKIFYDLPEVHAYLPVSWGSGGEPADLSSVELALCAFDQEAGQSLPGQQSLVYTTGSPANGEFAIDTSADPVVHCNFTGWLVNGNYVTFRIRVNGVWSTVNLPSDLVPALYQPTVPTLSAFPQRCMPSVDYLQLFYPEPLVRRSPEVYYDSIEEAIKPEDPVGYNEILKTSGQEFALDYRGEMYPKVAVAEIASPDQIHSLADGIPSVYVSHHSPHRLCLDISAISVEYPSGFPDRTYSYKLFAHDGTALGKGSFTLAPVDYEPAKPTGIDWGVDVWAGTGIEVGGQDYVYHYINASHVNSDSPDVIWFEIQDGWFFDPDQPDSGVYNAAADSPNGNVKVCFESEVLGDLMYADCTLRMVQTVTENSYIMLFVPDERAFTHPTAPDWPGILEPGNSYFVRLDDVRYDGYEDTLEYMLAITGENPNE
ncbi:fibronectin type III domain-containing protein [bacterium]|nr:fibronectin type III domain-containing protein [bacterium]